MKLDQDQISSSTRSITYGYDGLQRLTGATESCVAGACPIASTYGYTYDNAGNRLTATCSGSTSCPANTTRTYNAANQVSSAGFSYDAAGNLLGDGSSTYTYDALSRVTARSGTNFLSNGDGTLVHSGTTNYTQDIATPLSQILGDGTTTYVYGMERLYGIAGATRGWYTADALGSVRAATSDAGVVGAVAHYDPYGQIQSGSVGSFGFTGELQQGSSVYLRARWYNAGAGSFGVRDPFEGYAQAPYSQHYYAYGYSNPVLLTDPSGKNPSLCLALVLADGPIPAGDVLAVICALYFASLTTAATATMEGVVPPVTNTGNTMPAPGPFRLPPFSWGDWQGSNVFSDPVVNDPGICRTDSPLGPYEPGVLRTPPFPELAQHGPIVYAAQYTDHIVLGLRAHGLEQTAAQVGGRTLLSDPNWRNTFLNAISGGTTRFSVSIDGLGGTSTYAKVMGAVQRGLAPNASPTNWELAQLYQANLLKDVDFLENGGTIDNPFEE